MRHLPRALCSVLVLLALLGCSDAPERAADPTPHASPPANPPASPTPVAGEPVRVEVDYVEPQLLDNAVLRGKPQRTPSEGTVDAAVAAATAALERYLTAQFIDPDTRFGSEGLTALVGEEAADALDGEARRGLGELDLSAHRTDAEPVVAQAVVLTDGDDLLLVTLVFDAVVTITDAEGATERLRQEGRLLFPAQEGEAWQAEMLELTIEAPEGART